MHFCEENGKSSMRFRFDYLLGQLRRLNWVLYKKIDLLEALYSA